MRLLFVCIKLFLFICVTESAINPYDVLQLPKNSTQKQIRLRYKQLKKSQKNNKFKQDLYKQAFEQIMLQNTLQLTLAKDSPQKIPKRNNRRGLGRGRGLPRLSDMFRKDYFNPNKITPNKNVKKILSQKTFEQDQQNYQDEIRNEQINQFNSSFYEQEMKSGKVLRDQNVSFNMKVARFVLFISGILVKLLPCFCIFFIFKYRKHNQMGHTDQNTKQNLNQNQNQNQNQREHLNEDENPFVKAANGWTGKNRKVYKKK